MTINEAADRICVLAEKRGLVFASDVQREVFSSALETIIAACMNSDGGYQSTKESETK